MVVNRNTVTNVSPCSSSAKFHQVHISPSLNTLCVFFKIYKCRYCSATRINRRKRNDHRNIKEHIETTHPEKITSLTSPDIQQSLVLNDTAAFKNDDSVTNTCGGLVNDGTETETDFLGHNEPSDENLVSHLVDSISENNSDNQCNSYEYSPPPPARKVDNLDSFKFFSDNKSNVYFWQDYICSQDREPRGGFRGIVWRSLARLDLYERDKIASQGDARLLFNMADHYSSCGAEQKEVFLDIVEDLLDRSTKFQGIQIPDDHKSSNHILMDRTFGIRRNLPHEEVAVIAGHAYVSLIGVLQHLFAHKIPIGFAEETDTEEYRRDRTQTNGCPAMDALLKHMKEQNTENLPTKYGGFVLWSDGFVKSWIKQKENNAWMLTVTFPDLDGSATSKVHTSCLVVGKSSKNHQPVLDYYMDQVETLTNEGVDVFCTVNGVHRRVQMGLLAYIADRPERHTILCQLDGGHFGKRTLWSAVIDNKNLPYCDKCFQLEVKSLLCDCYADSDRHVCGCCCQWDLTSPSSANTKVNVADVRTTANCPTVVDPHSPQAPRHRDVPSSCLKPVQLDFEWLLCVLRYAAHNVVHSEWNKGQARAYCTSASINERATEKMIDKFHSMKATDDPNGEAVKSNDYVPGIWLTSVAMSAWIEAGMHHIFHGIVARVMLLFEQFFKDEDKNTEFEALANPHLLEIASLCLDWLHIRSLPKTMWLAEDELGLSRIMSFVYGQFFLNMQLRESTNTSKNSLAALRQLLASFQVVTVLLMSPREPAVVVIDRHIQIFLSCYHRFCQLYYGDDVIPFWARTSNLPSMLNLAAQIKNMVRYGGTGRRPVSVTSRP